MRTPRQLGAVHDVDLSVKFREFRDTRDRSIRNELIEAHEWVAHTVARRFANRGEPLDDLVQVARLGLLKAVDRFDPDFGASFASFAMPTVIGEVRRHFRDATWALRVPRRAKELHLELAGAVASLSQCLGRAPSIVELSEVLGVRRDEVLEAMEAGNAYRTRPLTRAHVDGGDDDSRYLSHHDAALGGSDLRVALTSLLDRLAPRERRILRMRFFGELTQSEIAERVGVSQVHVSRLLRASMTKLRQAMEEDMHA